MKNDLTIYKLTTHFNITVLPPDVYICGIAPRPSWLIAGVTTVVWGIYQGVIREVVTSLAVRMWCLTIPSLTGFTRSGHINAAFVFSTKLAVLAGGCLCQYKPCNSSEDDDDDDDDDDDNKQKTKQTDLVYRGSKIYVGQIDLISLSLSYPGSSSYQAFGSTQFDIHWQPYYIWTMSLYFCGKEVC